MSAKLVLLALMTASQVACAASDTKTTAETTKTPAPAVTTSAAKAPSKGGGFVEDRLKFQVTGMHCGGCADSIVEEVKKVPGVAEVTADYKTGEVVVISSGPSKLERAPVKKAIEGAGTFKVKK